MEETKLLQKHESSAKNVEEGRMTYMASSNTDIPIDSLIKILMIFHLAKDHST